MKERDVPVVFTVGHSTHTHERFLELLRQEGVTAIADVRSSPYSKHLPQFNSNALKDICLREGIAYSYLGKELGGRPRSSQLFRDGVADYERMANSDDFNRGLDRVLDGARTYRIVLMCSEHDPLDCHRCLLVGRALARRGVAVKHILSDGGVIAHSEIEDTLLRLSGRECDDLFASREERLEIAYRERARRIAFGEPERSRSSR